MRQLFLDCDGVIAGFTQYFVEVYGVNPHDFERKHGTESLYRDLRRHTDFYFNLPVLEDGRKLYEAVKHLNPIILTGMPRDGQVWAAEQKHRWTAKHFPGVETIVCLSKDKCQHMRNIGDVLVDDRLKYKKYWVDAGGVFVLHLSAAESITELQRLEVL